MKSYEYACPDKDGNYVEEILTEKDIIERYFDCWSCSMSVKGKAHLISYANCIKDWVTCNWAVEV